MPNHLPFPPEIRQRIYELVLAVNLEDSEPNSCYISFKTLPSDGKTLRDLRPTILDLSLLLVSQQTYSETFETFYRINHFTFVSTDTLYTFLKNIGLARRQAITSISLVLFGSQGLEALQMMRSCTNLKRLEVRLMTERLSKEKFEALSLLRGIESVEFVLIPCPYPKSMGELCYCDGPRWDVRGLEKSMMQLEL